MSGIFSPPKLPPTPEPIKPPTVDDARQAEEDMLKLRRRRGLASTFLAGKVRPSAAGSLLGAASPAGTADPAAAPGPGKNAASMQ